MCVLLLITKSFIPYDFQWSIDVWGPMTYISTLALPHSVPEQCLSLQTRILHLSGQSLAGPQVNPFQALCLPNNAISPILSFASSCWMSSSHSVPLGLWCHMVSPHSPLHLIAHIVFLSNLKCIQCSPMLLIVASKNIWLSRWCSILWKSLLLGEVIVVPAHFCNSHKSNLITSFLLLSNAVLFLRW